MKLNIKALALVPTLFLAACSSTPTVDNYHKQMNTPQLKSGSAGAVDDQVVNKAGWNKIAVTQMSSHRTLEDGHYSTDPSQGVLTVRASLVNDGTTPVQGNWRCKFYDSNNMPLYETASNQVATDSDSLGWHRMIVHPLKSKSQTHESNVVYCKALDPYAVNYRIEFHDTANDITVYKR
jgi:hypothetical protein